MLLNKWRVYQEKIDKQKEFSSNLKISQILAQILINRGIEDVYSAKKFLNPDIHNLPDPFELAGVKQAMEIIMESIKKDEKILVFGDYDVDGICGVVLLVSLINKLKGKVHYYIPSRLKEGYGLNKKMVSQIYDKGFSLIITVDCGIKNNEEIKYAKELGMKVIVTDHHLASSHIPSADSLINPKINKSDVYKNLSGVGVVYNLARAFFPEDLNFLDLVTLGTVGDMVPLCDENRILVKEGLNFLKESKRCGIKALLKTTGLEMKEELNAYFHLGFILCPRINSAGRVWEAPYAVELLLTEDYSKAEKIAQNLETKNKERQDIQKEILDNALEKIKQEIDLENERIIVLAEKGWHKGVIGIVASNIVEMYFRPTIIISIPEDPTQKVAHGSSRSIETFNIFEYLSQCEDLLLKFGGHKLAAGLTIEIDKIKDLKKRMNELSKNISSEELVQKIYIDKILSLNEINKDLCYELKKLEPYGEGNSIPLFLTKNLDLQEAWIVGNNYLKIKVKEKDKIMEAIGFKMGDRLSEILKYKKIDLVYSLEINKWNNEETPQINIKDLRESE